MRHFPHTATARMRVVKTEMSMTAKPNIGKKLLLWLFRLVGHQVVDVAVKPKPLGAMWYVEDTCECYVQTENGPQLLMYGPKDPVHRSPFKPFVGTKIIFAAPYNKDGKEGYAVLYEDNYLSWSPTAAFKGAYQLDTFLSMGNAMAVMSSGIAARRCAWPHTDFVSLVKEGGQERYYYFYNHGQGQERRQWKPSHDDMVTADWCLFR